MALNGTQYYAQVKFTPHKNFSALLKKTETIVVSPLECRLYYAFQNTLSARILRSVNIFQVSQSFTTIQNTLKSTLTSNDCFTYYRQAILFSLSQCIRCTPNIV